MFTTLNPAFIGLTEGPDSTNANPTRTVDSLLAFCWHEGTMGRSSAETIIGDLFDPQNLLRHLPGRPVWSRSDGAWIPSSTSFRDRITENRVRVLIDFILFSGGLQPDPNINPPYYVWNPYAQPVETAAINAALRNASDHFPVPLDLA